MLTTELVYSVGGVIFLTFLFGGFVRTLARVVYYHANHADRPRLLTRDLIVIGGLSVSFGLITIIRFLPPDQRLALTVGNVGWALTTTLPACIAVVVYAFYEYAVIERPRS